ncbi:MAG: ABC transporter permease [Terriglobia bacterium]
MLSRIVGQSLNRRRRRKLLSLFAVTLGIAVVTAVAAIALDVGDRVSRELRSMGANIEVTPASDGLPVSVDGVDFRPAGTGAYLNEADLINIKHIFWENNILAVAPQLDVPAKIDGRRVVLIGTWFDHTLPVSKGLDFTTGVKALHPGWKVIGQWPAAGDEQGVLAGARLARSLGLQPGQQVTISVVPANPIQASTPDRFSAAGASQGPSRASFVVRGIVEAGGAVDAEIMAPLAAVQRLAGLEGKVRRVEVSALAKADDARARMDVSHMTPEQFEMWSCTNYVSTIAYQIQQAIPGSEAKPVRRAEETEGTILDRVGMLMATLAGAALLVAALAMASVMLANVLERRAEIGLFKSLGATDGRVASIFLLEAAMAGVVGGMAGYFLGSLLANRLSAGIFGSPVGLHWIILPVVLALAVLVSLGGSALPLLSGMKIPASVALRNQ